jgi:hypothetical protein
MLLLSHQNERVQIALKDFNDLCSMTNFEDIIYFNLGALNLCTDCMVYEVTVSLTVADVCGIKLGLSPDSRIRNFGDSGFCIVSVSFHSRCWMM